MTTIEHEHELDDLAGAAIDDTAVGDRRRRRFVRLIIAVVVLGAVAAGVVFVTRSRSDSSAVAPPPPPTTAVLVVRSIADSNTFDGTVSNTSAHPVIARSSGRLTALAQEGRRMSLGDILYAVETVPTVLLYGDLPGWRDLNSKSAKGPDITQLEQSLVALGYDPDGRVTVDDTWSGATTDAVKRWQKSLAVKQTGEVPLAAIVFEPTTVVMGAQTGNVGSSVSAGSELAKIQSSGLVMEFTIKADTNTIIVIGQTVDVTMPDRTLAKGTITAIGTGVDPLTGTQTSVGSGTVESKPETAAVPDAAPIKVRVTQTTASAVLVAPANALASHVSGVFTLAVVQPDGTAKETPVKIGVSGGGFVEVTAPGLVAGTKVVVPDDR